MIHLSKRPRLVRILVLMIPAVLLLSCNNQQEDPADFQDEPSDNYLSPWETERPSTQKSSASVAKRNQQVRSGNTDICLEYQSFKRKNRVATGIYKGNVLKPSFKYEELYSNSSPLDFCDHGAVEITHNAVFVESSMLFEFFQNEANQSEYGINVVDGMVLTTRQLHGGPFKKGDFPYFFYQDIRFYKISPTEYLMTARPAKWTIADEDYVMYHYYNLERGIVTQFADLKSLIK